MYPVQTFCIEWEAHSRHTIFKVHDTRGNCLILQGLLLNQLEGAARVYYKRLSDDTSFGITVQEAITRFELKLELA